MLVFFRRIPSGTRKSEIERFIANALKGGLFSKRGEMTHISFIERRNPSVNTLDYHAVVTIEPDSVAERVIKKMNRKVFKGKYIEVRRYYIRNPANDPRNKNNILDDVPDSRRVAERRQKQNELNTALQYTAIKNFHRKYD